MKTTILASIFLTIASAATLPITHLSAPPATEDTHAIFYPGTAQSSQARTLLTNAELMRLGQPIAKPVKLYDAIVLAKRLIPAPPTASSSPASSAGRAYRFVTCTEDVHLGTGANDGSYTVSNADPEQKANQCASRSQVDGPATNYPERFVILRGSNFNCYTRVTTYTSDPCTSTNYAIYELAP